MTRSHTTRSHVSNRSRLSSAAFGRVRPRKVVPWENLSVELEPPLPWRPNLPRPLRYTFDLALWQATFAWVPRLRSISDCPEHEWLVGFWKQVSSDRRAFDGATLRSSPPRIGFLIFTAAGHMAVHLMDADRKKYAAAEPTPREAQMALSTYGSAYFGPYFVNETERYEVTRQIGTIIQAQVGMNAQRHLDFVGDNRLILKPPPDMVDGQFAQGYVTWERVTPAVGSTQ